MSELDRSRTRLDQAKQCVHKRRLAGARPANDRKQAGYRQAQADLIESDALAKSNLKVAHLQKSGCVDLEWLRGAISTLRFGSGGALQFVERFESVRIAI